MVEAFWRFEQIPFSSEMALQTWQKAWAQPDFVRGWLLEFESQTVGYVVLTFGFSLEFKGRDAFVDELYVCPEKRGSGLGRALLRALEAEARASGVRQLHLEVEIHNRAARKLYVGEGFAANGRELLSKALA